MDQFSTKKKFASDWFESVPGFERRNIFLNPYWSKKFMVFRNRMRGKSHFCYLFNYLSLSTHFLKKMLKVSLDGGVNKFFFFPKMGTCSPVTLTWQQGALPLVDSIERSNLCFDPCLLPSNFIYGIIKSLQKVWGSFLRMLLILIELLVVPGSFIHHHLLRDTCLPSHEPQLRATTQPHFFGLSTKTADSFPYRVLSNLAPKWSTSFESIEVGSSVQKPKSGISPSQDREKSKFPLDASHQKHETGK